MVNEFTQFFLLYDISDDSGLKDDTSGIELGM